MRTVPRLCGFYPSICLTTEEKARENLSQGRMGRVFPNCLVLTVRSDTCVLKTNWHEFWDLTNKWQLWGETSPLCVTNIIKMKRNSSLNTTDGLLAKMESSYVTTCFGLLLWPSSGYNLVALRVDTICLTLRRLMSYIYGAPILDVSRSHTTTQHSR